MTTNISCDFSAVVGYCGALFGYILPIIERDTGHVLRRRISHSNIAISNIACSARSAG
jgi:hypothetical protein